MLAPGVTGAKNARVFAEYQPHRPTPAAPVEVEVREARASDLAAIERVEDAADRAACPDGVRTAIADPRRLVVVAEVAGTVVGWAKTHHFDLPDGEAPAGHYLAGVTVDPRARRRGVGHALTGARIGWVAGRAARVHYLVNARNTVSLALHERWGFREIARGPTFHQVPFVGGLGLVLAADLAQRADRRGSSGSGRQSELPS